MAPVRWFCVSVFILSSFVLSCRTAEVQKKESAEIKEGQTLAVMSFDSINAGKDIGVAVSEIIRSEISSMDDIPYTVVERIMLNRVLQEQELSMTGLVSTSRAVKIGKILYANYLLMGRVIEAGDRYRISASIVETNTAIVKKQVYEDVRGEHDIPLASKAVSYKLFDRQIDYGQPGEKPALSVDGTYASVYTDARGIHHGGSIVLRIKGNRVQGYNIAQIGRADMYGVIEGDFINGYYKAHYGYGNFTFRVSEGGKHLIGSYYQVSNGAHGDWIAVRGDAFKLPDELYTGKWETGDRCLVKWSGDGYWYPGRVARKEDGLYFIAYDDGDKEWRFEKYIREENLKPGDVVFAKWKSGRRYYRGKIAMRKGDNIFINYDDGDKEWTTVSMVRVIID